MQTTNADVILVGCGPIGSYLAWKLAQAGLHVIGLEKTNEGQPLSSIGLFHFEDVAFDHLDIPRPTPEKIFHRYPGMTIHAPDPSLFLEVTGVETCVMDLHTYISDMHALAQNAGVTIRHGVKVESIIREGGRVVGVVAKQNGETNEYRAPVVVDASGLARVVRRHIPAMAFPGDQKFFTVYLEYWDNSAHQRHLGIHSYAGLNGWTAAYDGSWGIGIGQPASLEATKRLHADFAAKYYPGSKTVLETIAGVVPYAYSPPTFVDEGVVVLGDAGATNKPFNGEGIPSGSALAKIAAEIIPAAVKAGGTRESLWEINRRYNADQGAKFAFLHAMGETLLSLTLEDLTWTYRCGMVTAEDLRQTFLDYEVQKRPAELLAMAGKLLRRPGLAYRYGRAIAKASRVSALVKHYPTPNDFPRWRQRFLRTI